LAAGQVCRKVSDLAEKEKDNTLIHKHLFEYQPARSNIILQTWPKIYHLKGPNPKRARNAAILCPKCHENTKRARNAAILCPFSCPFLLLFAEEGELSWFHIGRKDDIAILL
jgi:hypothetical protein